MIFTRITPGFAGVLGSGGGGKWLWRSGMLAVAGCGSHDGVFVLFADHDVSVVFAVF
jgi:hypothetical protein